MSIFRQPGWHLTEYSGRFMSYLLCSYQGDVEVILVNTFWFQLNEIIVRLSRLSLEEGRGGEAPSTPSGRATSPPDGLQVSLTQSVSERESVSKPCRHLEPTLLESMKLIGLFNMIQPINQHYAF